MLGSLDDIALQTHERLITPAEEMDFDIVFSSDRTSTRPLPWSWRETKINLVSIRDNIDPQTMLRTAQNLVTPFRSILNHPIVRAERSLKSILLTGRPGQKRLRFKSESGGLSDSTVIVLPTTVAPTPRPSSATKSDFLLSQDDLLKLKKSTVFVKR